MLCCLGFCSACRVILRLGKTVASEFEALVRAGSSQQESMEVSLVLFMGEQRKFTASSNITKFK